MMKFAIYYENKEGKYDHFCTVDSIPRRNAATAELRAEGKKIKTLTYYPDGTVCVSECHPINNTHKA